MRSAWKFQGRNEDMEMKGFSAVDMMGFERSSVPESISAKRMGEKYDELINYLVMSGTECVKRTFETEAIAKLEYGRIYTSLRRTGNSDKYFAQKTGKDVYIIKGRRPR